MDRKKLLEKYNSNSLNTPFIKENLTYAFGKEQLQEAIKKLGAKSEDDLTSIFGAGDVCLKSKANEILKVYKKLQKEKEKWLKNLTAEEKEIITIYEFDNHECTYTYNIEPVLIILESYFGRDFIIKVWNKLKNNRG